MAEWVLKDAEAVREELTKEQENEISLLYRKVYLQVKHELDITPANGTATQHLQRQRLWQIKRQLDEAYKSLGIGLEKSIVKEAKKAAQGVIDDINAKTSKLGLRIEGAYAHVPTDIVNALVSGKVYEGDWKLSSAIWRDIDKHQSDISKIIAEGVAANKGAYDIAKDLEKYVNPSAKKDWEWSKVYPGTSKKVDYNAQRLARTMVSHAYQQSLERVCKNNPFVDGYIWSASGVHTCPLCEERDGQLFAKGDLPLDHPNGMCTFIAHIPEDMSKVADRLADWVNGKEDPGLEKWYNSMLNVNSSKPQNENPSISTPNTDKWIAMAKDQDWKSIQQAGRTELSKLSTSEKRGITTYTSNAYKEMNSYLRLKQQGHSEEQAIKVSKIGTSQLNAVIEAQNGINKLKTTEPMVLRRGSDLGDLAGFLSGDFSKNKRSLEDKSVEELNSMFSGSVGVYASFLSTTPSYNSGFYDDVEYVIYAPAGTKGAIVDSISEHKSENEFLVQAGTRVRVLSVEESKDHHMWSDIRVFMEIIPDE